MKKKIAIKKIAFMIFIIVNIAALMLVSATLAKYTREEEAEDTIVFEDFDVSIDKINGVDWSALRAAGKIDASGVITLTKEEYKDFSLSIKYKGKGKSYIRILVSESWINSVNNIQTVVFSGLSGYSLVNVACDNRTVDGYLYLQGPTYNNSDTERIIPVITDATANPISGIDSTHVKIIIKIDAVQYNRYKALWDISNIPH